MSKIIRRHRQLRHSSRLHRTLFCCLNKEINNNITAYQAKFQCRNKEKKNQPTKDKTSATFTSAIVPQGRCGQCDKENITLIQLQTVLIQVNTNINLYSIKQRCTCAYAESCRLPISPLITTVQYGSILCTCSHHVCQYDS